MYTDVQVNCNLYGSKDYEWLSGGPSNGAPALSEGHYFFTVTYV
jgi:hypothetical protein